MLATRLIRLIETNADELTRGLVQQLKANPRTPAFRRFSDLEIHNRVYNVYKNLGAWIAGTSESEVRRHYEELGGRRFAEGVPLPQVISAQILTKNHLLNYVQTHGLGGTALEMYSEQELRRQVEQFFDSAVYYTALGYHNAQEAGKAGGALSS
jgi:hypothetical protein